MGMVYWKLILCGVIGYLLGSVSSAVLVSKFFERKDIRSVGSGNAGATNMTRVFGWGAGVATLVCDILKTVASMLLGKLLHGPEGMMAAGVMCFLGHCFPVYFGFKGGKGIAVGAAVGFMLSPWMFLMILGVFAVVAALTRRVSAASVAAAVSYPLAAYLAGVREPYQLICCALMAALAIFMHRANIARLIKGTEPVFRPGGKKK